MIGWLIFLIVVALICLTTVIVVMITRQAKSLKRNQVMLIDFEDFDEHGMFKFIPIHRPMRTGNIFFSASPDEKIVKEKDFKKTQHKIDAHDYTDFFDSKTGGRIIINKMSVLTGSWDRKFQDAEFKILSLESENSALREDVLRLESEQDQKIDKRIKSMGDLVKASQPMMFKPKPGSGGSSYGR